MRNSLLYKLLGAFLLVIALGAVVISLLVSNATQNAFSIYTNRNGRALAEKLSSILGEYYLLSNSWQGVDVFLQSDLVSQYGVTTIPSATAISSTTTSGSEGNSGNNPGHGYGMGWQSQNALMGTMAGQRLILVNENGTILADSENELLGSTLSSTELEEGVSIIVKEKVVGTIIVTPLNFAGPATPGGEFLKSVNQSIVFSVGIASVLALILGALLFIQLTSPLRKLQKAATAIGQGDLRQRVKISSKDELGNLGRAFNTMAENLEQLEIQRKHLVADVAHELRTPLAAVQATLEGIQDGILPHDDEQLSAIHSQILLLNRLVDDLRLLSLAEAGHLLLERQLVNVGGLVKLVIQQMHSQALQKKIRLQVKAERDLPDSWVDTDRMRQVLYNLISNSLRFTPIGGVIDIELKRSSSGKPGILITVSDTGPGISKEVLPFVFDRFYRAEKSRSRQSGGSGLGLTIVKQLVEAHGGNVQAISPIYEDRGKLSYGSRFIIFLPDIRLGKT
jgi:signal transduction histidine kinase